MIYTDSARGSVREFLKRSPNSLQDTTMPTKKQRIEKAPMKKAMKKVAKKVAKKAAKKGY